MGGGGLTPPPPMFRHICCQKALCISDYYKHAHVHFTHNYWHTFIQLLLIKVKYGRCLGREESMLAYLLKNVFPRCVQVFNQTRRNDRPLPEIVREGGYYSELGKDTSKNKERKRIMHDTLCFRLDPVYFANNKQT